MEEGIEVILDCSCGLDVHEEMIETCIIKVSDDAEYRKRFGCTSGELDKLCEWINEHECKDVAMESTGVAYYDDAHKQAVSIDLAHAHKGVQPHRHVYLSHDKNDPGVPPTSAEMALIEKIKKEFHLR